MLNWADPLSKIVLYVCAAGVTLYFVNVFSVVSFLHAHINPYPANVENMVSSYQC
jgi:hypothetical protein